MFIRSLAVMLFSDEGWVAGGGVSGAEGEAFVCEGFEVGWGGELVLDDVLCHGAAAGFGPD